MAATQHRMVGALQLAEQGAGQLGRAVLGGALGHVQQDAVHRGVAARQVQAAVPVFAAGELAHGPTRALFGQGVDGCAARGRIGPGVGMQADEQVGVGLPGDGHAAIQGDIGVTFPRQPHPIPAGALQLLLEGQGGGQGDGALTGFGPVGTRIAAAVAGVDEDEGPFGRPLGAARRRGRNPARTRRRGAACGLEVDHIAEMGDAVAGRQQEAALDLGAGRQVQLDPRGGARAGHPPAAHQPRAGTGQAAAGRRNARQRHHHPTVVAGLNHLAARGPVQIEHHAGMFSVAAEANAQHLAHGPGRQPPAGRQQNDANHDEGHRRHRPFARAPLRQVYTRQSVHFDGDPPSWLGPS